MAIQIGQCLPHKIHRRDSKENQSFKEADQGTKTQRLIKECSQSEGNYKRLLTLYDQHPKELLAFLEYAKAKATCLYRYVNTATSYKNWGKTLYDWTINIAKAMDVRRYAPEVISRLRIIDDQKKCIIKAICHRLGRGSLSIAASIQDKTGIRDKFAYYLWRTSSKVIKQLSQERILATP